MVIRTRYAIVCDQCGSEEDVSSFRVAIGKAPNRRSGGLDACRLCLESTSFTKWAALVGAGTNPDGRLWTSRLATPEQIERAARMRGADA